MPAVEVAPSIAKFTQLPSSLQKRGKVLLNQQCWLWGQDVRRPEGNLLLERGFERLRPPEEAGGATQYTLFLTNDLRVRLWGFGMYFGGVQGVYVNRYEFVPRSASFAYEWQTAETMGSFHRCSDFFRGFGIAVNPFRHACIRQDAAHFFLYTPPVLGSAQAQAAMGGFVHVADRQGCHDSNASIASAGAQSPRSRPRAMTTCWIWLVPS